MNLSATPDPFLYERTQRDWSAFYAPGTEIHQYLEDVVAKYKLMQYIKLRHELTHARYDELSGKWHIRIRRPNATTGELEEFTDTADVLFTAFGGLSRWRMPDIEGIDTFKGELHHSAGFDPEDKTWQEVVAGWRSKTVGVIGVVSTPKPTWTFCCS